MKNVVEERIIVGSGCAFLAWAGGRLGQIWFFASYYRCGCTCQIRLCRTPKERTTAGRASSREVY